MFICFTQFLQKSVVKICEGPEILLYLDVNMLACHNYMDVGRRRETPESQMKVFTAHININSQNISICFSSLRSKQCLHTLEGHSAGEES